MSHSPDPRGAMLPRGGGARASVKMNKNWLEILYILSIAFFGGCGIIIIKKGVMTMTEAQISSMMKALKISREEAIEVLKEDEAIDKMSMSEVDNDLTAEQKKAKKEATKTTGDKRTRKKETKPRERKPDLIKREIIDTIVHNLDRCCIGENLDHPQNIKAVNIEREITFTVYGEEYSLVLTKHRAKKGS